MKQYTVASLADLVDGRVVGDADRLIRGVCDLRTASLDQLGFVRTPKYRDAVRDCSAGALIVGEELQTGASLIIVQDVRVGFAKIALLFHPMPKAEQHRVHASAVLDPSAELGDPVQIGPRVVVDAGASIGAGSVIMAGAIIGEDCRIGLDCVIYPGVILYPGSKLGDRVLIHGGTVVGSDGFGYALQGSHYIKLPQLGDVRIGDDVEIGANCTIDRGTLGPTRIGRGSKVDNLVHIAHNCVLGQDNAVAALCALSGSTVLGDRVVLGGHTVTGGHLRVVDDTRIGGNSAIKNDVTEAGEYMGWPLMEKRRFGRHLRALRYLVDMYQDVGKLTKSEG